jgi:uncharacterized protein
VLSCPEPSLAGVVAVEYLIDALNMEEIGAIRITEMPPIIAVVNGAAKLPHRIFYSRQTGVVAVRQHVPIPPQIYAEFIHKVLDWAEENKVKLVACLSAMPAVGDKESDKVYFVTEEELVEKFKQYGFEPIKEATVAGLEGAYLDAVLDRKHRRRPPNRRIQAPHRHQKTRRQRQSHKPQRRNAHTKTTSSAA